MSSRKGGLCLFLLPVVPPRPQWTVWRGTDSPWRCVNGGRKPRPGVRGHERARGTWSGEAALRQESYSVKSRRNTTSDPPFPPQPPSQQEGRLRSPAQGLPLRWSSGPCPFNENHRIGSANKTLAVPSWAAWGPTYFTLRNGATWPWARESGPAWPGTGVAQWAWADIDGRWHR